MQEQIKKGKRGKPFKHEASFRRKVMEELYSGTITVRELMRKYNLSGGSITSWKQWYEQDQAALLTSSVMNESKDQDEQPRQDEAPATGQNAAELAAVQEELRLVKIKLACLETLIDLTEQDLGVDIRKKAGTRSSAE